MKKYIVTGGNKLKGEVSISGSKNVVLKVLVAACLTDETIEITNVPLISDFYSMVDLIRHIGGDVKILDHKVLIKLEKIKDHKIPLEIGAKIKTSSMFLAPLLIRSKKALIPNPGGCRIGARPIDRHIEGLEKMGAKIDYNSEDGYFYASTDGLKGAIYKFEKNSHTGTETLIIAGVLAKGRTIIENAALEPEVDDLIRMLNAMGAKIKRQENRTIVIDGVKKLKGVSFKIMPDRNELVTFALISALTGGEIIIKNANLETISSFLKKFEEAGGVWESMECGTRFFIKDKIAPTDVVIGPHPEFMTDWHGLWVILMTQAQGASTIHETVYENRFGYIKELKKMGAKFKLFDPEVKDPEKFYNFNYSEADKNQKHAVKIIGKSNLHNAVLTVTDLRAGATLVLAALIARGESIIFEIEHLERGYENFDERLRRLGANITVEEEPYE